MKLLLTSRGVINDRIKGALEDLLGKPIADSTALFVPTAVYAYANGVNYAWRGLRMHGDLGWKQYGVLELAALPSVPKEAWLPQLEEADAVIVGGGNNFYLSYWMQESGLFEMLPGLLEGGKVYVGISAGSMVLTRGFDFERERFEKTGVYYDEEFDEEMASNTGSHEGLGLVDFLIRPHLNSEMFPGITLESVEERAAKAGAPMYALDDDSAIKVQDGNIEVVSAGVWKLFD